MICKFIKCVTASCQASLINLPENEVDEYKNDLQYTKVYAHIKSIFTYF